MPTTISVQDLATDRDVAITVAGLPTDHTANVYIMRTDEDDPSSWTLLTSITSDGTSNHVMPLNGYYWFHALVTDDLVEAAPVLTNFARSVISSGAARFDQIVDCVQARIQDSINSAGFPKITDPKRCVTSYKYDPIVFTANVPGIAVVGNGRKIPLGGDNEEDDKGYPILVICADRATSNTPRRNNDPYYLWHERLEELFLHKRMNSVTQNGIPIVFDVEISYPEVVQFIENTYQDVRVALQLNVKTREARTP